MIQLSTYQVEVGTKFTVIRSKLYNGIVFYLCFGCSLEYIK